MIHVHVAQERSLKNAMECKVVIENKKGTYKSFVDDNDPGSTDYPLKGVTYPVDYGYIEEYWGEDGDELDVFVGTGDIGGYMKIWRYDIDVLETKMIFNVTESEWKNVIETFSPVVKEEKRFSNEDEKAEFLGKFKLEE